MLLDGVVEDSGGDDDVRRPERVQQRGDLERVEDEPGVIGLAQAPAVDVLGEADRSAGQWKLAREAGHDGERVGLSDRNHPSRPALDRTDRRCPVL